MNTIKKKKSNLGLFSFVLIVAVMLVGVLFSNSKVATASSSDTATTAVTYSSYKTIIYYENGVTSMTTVIGCASNSGDKYDMNTGKRCVNNTKPVVIGCAPNSGDVYNMNTGKRCTNDTAKAKVVNIIATATPTEKSIATNVPPSGVVVKATEISPIANETIETIPSENVSDEGKSGREVLADSLTASASKVSSIFKGHMSIWIILLIVAILLGGGYGIYSLMNKGNVKKIVNPVIPQAKTASAQPVAPINPGTPNPQASLLNNTQNTNSAVKEQPTVTPAPSVNTDQNQQNMHK